MSPSSRFVPASPNYTVVKKRSPLEDGLPRMRWAERWKTDFYLARPAYRVKTTGQAVKVLFSPFWQVPDLINPQFILDGDHLYGKPVENLVIAVRGLSSKAYKNAQQTIRRIPLFNTILQVIREWDVDGMNRELTVLQREPRNRSFADLGPLVASILRPMFQLTRLNSNVHLLPAISKMYEAARMYLTSRDERELLQRYYSIAREELPIVFSQVKMRLYPVLLKLLSDRFMEPDQFFLDKEEDLLAFLGLSEEDLVRDLPETHPVETPTQIAGPKPLEADPTPKLAREGLKLLDELFPRSGWLSLDRSPDLFGYFQSIFEYPKGSDLVPIDDPLQIIQPLSEVLQHLFYGFQNIQWGTAVNQAGEVVRLQEELDKAIARWHFFHEEFFGKNYLPLLQEYCREVERAGPLSTESKRREHQLLWFKRNYLLPHLILPVMDDVRVKSLGYPNLALQVREVLDLLAPIAVEVEQKGTKSAALLNPETRVKFPVTNMVSHRFQNVLRRTDTNASGDKRVLDHGHNRSLLFYTVALLSTLDDMLSRSSSLLYSRSPKHLFRTSGQVGDDKPVYNAPKRNSATLLKKLNEQAPPDLSEKPWQTKVGDLYGPFVSAEEIKARILEHHNDKKPFALVSFRVWPEESSASFVAFASALLDAGTKLIPQDDGSWHYVMRDTLEEEAEDFARKVLAGAARHQPPLATGAIVVPFSTNWNLEKTVSVPPKGWAAATDIPPQVLGVWVNSTQSFDFRTDVPTVLVSSLPTDPHGDGDAFPDAAELVEV